MPRTLEDRMQFVYAAEFARTAPDEIVVSFRDIPECLTSGVDGRDVFAEATDALSKGKLCGVCPTPGTTQQSGRSKTRWSFSGNLSHDGGPPGLQS